MQHGVEPVPVGARRQVDALDHGADELHRLGAVRPLEHALERLHLAPVELRQARVEQDGEFGLVVSISPVLERGLLGLQRRHALLHHGLVEPVLDGPHDAGDLAVDLRHLPVALAVVGFAALAGLPEFLLNGRDKLGDEIGGEQPLLQALQHARLDLLAGDGAGIVAEALLAARGAAIAVLADDGVPAAAAAAAHEAGEKEAAAVRLVQRRARGGAYVVRPHLGLSGFHLVPERVVDDAQFRNRLHFPLVWRVRPGDAFARARVLDVAAAVPLQHTAIGGVVEEPGAAVRLAADGRVGPRPATGTGNAFLVQVFRDRLGALAAGELAENPLDDPGLVSLNLPGPATVSRLHDSVAVGEAARDLALQHAAELAPARLLAQVLQPHLRHHAHHGDMDRGDLAERGGEQLHPVKRELVLQVSRIRQPATQPVDGLADHHIEGLAGGVVHQLLEAGPEPARPAQRRVRVRPNHDPPLRRREPAAHLELVLDRGLALQVARVPRVDHRAHRRAPLESTK
ncbi:hypothetical protein NK718_02310 [Alsobacter sp. SYSU M60028]|uniref:Uncharacterized protein n=1 Tax=Alsobacter ponti TaxID=2962936 RepID=A0ABT1L787_9HYPH|nr:hypothetical protein [Alsobacter ponti]MCP8937336.1 hypothetical protein [Alsobacter ponti]